MPIVIEPVVAPSPGPNVRPVGSAPSSTAAAPTAEPWSEPAAPRWHGVYPAIVIDTHDPANAGRVRVTLPWATATGEAPLELWARLASPFAGPGIGAWFEPPISAEVLVAFIAGDPAAPCIVGGLWSVANPPPPGTVQTGRPEQHVIRTAAGAELRLGSAPGDAPVAVSTDGGEQVVIEADGGVRIEDRFGNRVRLGSEGVTIESAGRVAVAAGTMRVTAGQVTVDAGMVQTSGVLKCDTLIANSVVAQSYTPGAGNIR